MDPDKHEMCSICNEKISSCERTMIAEIMNLLKFVFLKMNSKLLQDSLICQTCLSKIQAAYKFKASYSDVSQKTLSSMVKEEPDSENYIICKICKSSVSSHECIPLFNSVTETGLSLIKYFSPQLESETYEELLSCESCHESLINFYDITNLLSTFSEDHIDQINNRHDVNVKEETLWSEDVYSANLEDTFRIDSKQEISDALEDVKEEIEIEESHLDIEQFNFKIENGEENVEINRTRQIEQREKSNSIFSDQIYHEVKLFKCQICEFQTKRKSDLKRHMLIHKNSDEVEMFKCQICTFQTKHKNSLKYHTINHKNSDEVEVFKCHDCEYKTKYKNLFKRHTLLHTNSEIFKCKNCEFTTKHKWNLKTHMFKHKHSDEVELFKCEICAYETKFKNTLKRHMLIHKNSDEVEMFECKNCAFKTKHKGNLKMHMLKHKNSDKIEMIKCQFCTFETKKKHYLKKHMLIHKNSNNVEIFNC